MVRVLLVDDHNVVRAGLKALLESTGRVDVVGEASTGEEAIDRARTLEPDIVIMDLAMPGMGGVQATRHITGLGLEARILVLTIHDEDEFLVPALNAGAAGFLNKSVADTDLMGAIEAIVRGHYLPAAPRSGPARAPESTGHIERQAGARGALRARAHCGRVVRERVFGQGDGRGDVSQPQDRGGLPRPRQNETGSAHPARHRALRPRGRAPAGRGRAVGLFLPPHRRISHGFGGDFPQNCRVFPLTAGSSQCRSYGCVAFRPSTKGDATMRNKALYLLPVAVMLAACTDITPPVTDRTPPTLGEGEDGLSTVAAAIARSMAAVGVRMSVLTAMRASRSVEHRLMLTNFLREEEGNAFLRESANALGISGPEFIARVEALGAIEIVVPIREHRLRWTGTAQIGVAGGWDSDVPDLVVYEPSRGSRRLGPSEALARYDALFLVRPMETIGTRIGRQADVPGAVIQDPDDGEVAVIWTLRSGDEEPKSVDFGSFVSDEALRDYLKAHFGTGATMLAQGECASCDGPGSGGTGGGSGAVSDSPTTLDAFAMNISTEIGSEEVEITVDYVNADGTWVSGTKRYEGVTPFVTYAPGDEMLPASPAPGGATFGVSAVETDWLFDDDLGSASFNYNTGPGTYVLTHIVVDLSW